MCSPTVCTPVAFEICLLTAIGKARALHFLKKLSLRGRGSGRKSKDTISPVAIPTQGFQRAHSSVDLLRKGPDISRIIGFRVEDGPNPMDTDDSSQDASASGNSPRLRPRRHSTWDSLHTAPIHSTFVAHGAAPLFFRDQAGPGNQILPDDPGSLIAPAPLCMRSLSLDAVAQPALSPVWSPEVPPQLSVCPESKPDEEAAQDTPNNDMTRPSGDVLSHHDTFTTPSTDCVPSASSEPGVLWGTQSLRAPEDSTSETVEGRPRLLSHHSAPCAPLPPTFRLTTERGLRLSPSIILRQPMPLLNLPALPPPPPAPDSLPRQRVPLRSIPSLSRHGRNTECQADHEHVTSGDSDEDDSDECDEEELVDALSVHQSDDEDNEPPSAGPSGARGLKSSQKQPIRDDESLTESPISPASPQGDFVGPNLADCSCSKTHVNTIHFAPSSNSLAMHTFSPNIPAEVVSVTQRYALDPDLPIPERKPPLYRVTSRSMVNLGSTRRAERGLGPLKSRETVGSNPASASGHTTETQEESEENDTEAAIGRLLRRTSMPSFHPTSDPPPYPTFDPRPRESRIGPHEDEGRERLPPYSNSLYLIASMPRKMEFSSPGVQAKDRKWRRVVCELEGTTFRVYKCPPGASGAGVLGDWWEKRVGVGDVACPNPPRTRKKGSEEQFERSTKLGIDESTTPVIPPPASSAGPPSVPSARRRTGSQSSMTTQSTMTSTPRPAKRASAASFLSPFRSLTTTRPEASTGEGSRPESHELELLPVDMQESRSSLSHESTGRATPAAQRLSQPPQPRSASRLTFLPVATGRAQWRNGEITKPPKSDQLRAYTLQHAESGLGNDYLKRKNVIRVRLEGEQFLLQAQDIPAVVEWIEVHSLQIW